MRALILISMIAIGCQASALQELFEGATWYPPYPLDPREMDLVKCKESFGWGRNQVRIENLEGGGAVDCSFSHTERVRIPKESKNPLNDVFVQYYTCTDGTRAWYTSNWMGSGYTFRHELNNGETIRCY